MTVPIGSIKTQRAFQKSGTEKTGKKWSVKQFKKYFQGVGTWVFRWEEPSTIDESRHILRDIVMKF